jgi:hypothetical protein
LFIRRKLSGMLHFVLEIMWSVGKAYYNGMIYNKCCMNVKFSVCVWKCCVYM